MTRLAVDNAELENPDLRLGSDQWPAWSLTYGRNAAEKKEAPITETKQAGNKVMFAAKLPGRGGTEASVTFHGIVSERGIAGWRMTDVDGQPRDMPWNAKRIKD